MAREAGLLALAMDSTGIAARAEEIHRSSAPVTAALGRLMTAAALMGCQLKKEGASVTLRLNGGGPAGSIIAVSDAEGNPRGYVANPLADAPLNAKGKLNVAGVVGTEGTLTVIRDGGEGSGEPYVGQTPIVSGEIAEDVTYYFRQSEQIPTACALGVLVGTDLHVLRAGGFLLQMLPGAPDGTADALEASLADIPSVTQMLGDGLTPLDILKRATGDLPLEVLEETTVEYRCNCSRDRVDRTLISLGKAELLQMAAEQPETEVGCHFCGKKYKYTPAALRALAETL